MEEQNIEIMFPIGKHKGEPIVKVIEDTTYCKWLLKQEWFSKKYPEVQKKIVLDRPKVIRPRRKKVNHKPVLNIKSNPMGICLN